MLDVYVQQYYTNDNDYDDDDDECDLSASCERQSRSKVRATYWKRKAKVGVNIKRYTIGP